MDPKTMGWGMVFFHECWHPIFGGSGIDVTGGFGTGDPVDFVNKIRSELGGSFGQRLNYEPIQIEMKRFIPFDVPSFENLKRGFRPPTDSKYIEY